MYKKLVPVLLMLVLFLPLGFSFEALGQKKKSAKSKRSSKPVKKRQVKRTSRSSPSNIGSVNRPDLPGFAYSPLHHSGVTTIVTKCSTDKRVLFFHIYKENLFFDRMMLYDGKVVIIGPNGLPQAVPEEPVMPLGVSLIQQIVKEFAPTFMELNPGREAALSTLVLTTNELTEDQIYAAYNSLRDYLTGYNFTVNFLNTCRYLFVPETPIDVSEPINQQNLPPID